MSLRDLPINFEQPIWLLLPIFIAAFALSAFLYYRNSRQGFSKRLSILLFFLRFSVLFLLALLLLNPYFIKKTKNLEKPKVVVAVDVSESMTNYTDSLSIQNTIYENVDQMKQQLSSQFDVDVLTFDKQTYNKDAISFNGKRTDIGQLLKYVKDKYYMLNLSAIVLLSDGQNNQGLNPVYSLSNISTEIYPVIYGDTLPLIDLSINKLFYNKVVRQGGKFPVEVVIQANGLLNEEIQVLIEHNGEVLATKPINISKGTYTKEVKFDIDTKSVGLQSFNVKIKSKASEKNLQNNSSKFYVQVVESGNKVLVLGKAPHPDLGAIASALQTNEGYSVNIKTLNDYPFKVDEYQLIILHGLPAKDERSNKILSQEIKGKAIWYMVSSSTDLDKLEQLNLPWEIANSNGNFEHVEAAYNEEFNNFKWPIEFKKSIEDFPPLYAPFSSYQNNQKAEVMLWQSMRGYATDKPLQIFWTRNARKYGLLTGEGLWKWRIYSFQNHGSHDMFNDFINRSARYLLTGIHTDQFNIIYKNVYHETDIIEWEAQVYNKSFELIPNAHISVEITDEDGIKYPYQFTAEGANYSLNLDYFKPGAYSFKTTAEIADTIYSKTGNFVVNAWNMEQASNGANRPLLNSLAQLTNGKSFYPSQINDLNQYLLKRPDFKPRSSFTQKLINLIDLKWLAIIIILLLGTEWVLRKRGGAY